MPRRKGVEKATGKRRSRRFAIPFYNGEEWVRQLKSLEDIERKTKTEIIREAVMDRYFFRSKPSSVIISEVIEEAKRKFFMALEDHDFKRIDITDLVTGWKFQPQDKKMPFKSEGEFFLVWHPSFKTIELFAKPIIGKMFLQLIDKRTKEITNLFDLKEIPELAAISKKAISINEIKENLESELQKYHNLRKEVRFPIHYEFTSIINLKPLVSYLEYGAPSSKVVHIKAEITRMGQKIQEAISYALSSKIYGLVSIFNDAEKEFVALIVMLDEALRKLITLEKIESSERRRIIGNALYFTLTAMLTETPAAYHPTGSDIVIVKLTSEELKDIYRAIEKGYVRSVDEAVVSAIENWMKNVAEKRTVAISVSDGRPHIKKALEIGRFKSPREVMELALTLLENKLSQGD